VEISLSRLATALDLGMIGNSSMFGISSGVPIGFKVTLLLPLATKKCGGISEENVAFCWVLGDF
jgi:hypothetical protein